jgi:hypothetical protein
MANIKYAILVIAAVAALLLLLPSASAYTFNPNFTAVTNSSNTVATLNQTYTLSDQPVTYVGIWFFDAIIGLVFFVLSCWFSTKSDCGEIDSMFAAMSTVPLFIAAFNSSAVDVVTGYGTTSQVINGIMYVYYSEQHTIYHFDFTGIEMWILVVISILNLMRIMLNKRNQQVILTGGREEDEFDLQ